MSDLNFTHWKCKKDEHDLLWACFDRAGSHVNTIDGDVLQELDQVIDLVKDRGFKGLIISSAKSSGFIAGADIEKFSTMTDSNEGLALIQLGGDVFSRLEALTVPTVALINGFCLGGGCELALACRYRVALDCPSVKIGLPEILLGLHPGWGGSVRLPKLINPMLAMDLMLTGRSVDGRKAAKIGLVTACVPLRQAARAAVQIALTKPLIKAQPLAQRLLNQLPIRLLLAKVMLYKVSKKVQKKHYPAPFAVIERWVKSGVSNAGYKDEVNSFARLFQSDTCKHLVQIFFLQNKMKNLPQAKDFDVQHVHVIGAGTMGGDIAAWCALKGFRVTLQDREPKFIAPAVARAIKLFKRKLKSSHLYQDACDRLTPDPLGQGVAHADIIIEAAFEDLAVKKSIFKEVEEKAKPGAILATNTSSIPLDDINQALNDPKRLVGIHFFNPVALMQLVEIVKGELTSQVNVEKATYFVRKIGKLPLPVKSRPGFLVNRVLMPYLMESVILLTEGVSKETIDAAAVDFGMPMGPIELADTVGLDICLSVAQELSQAFGRGGADIPLCLLQKVNDKKLGKKTGKGFYTFKNGKVIREKIVKAFDKDVSDRLIYRMLNESAACMREGIVSEADFLNAGMIFGTGFAPFRGGPMQYVLDQGYDKIIERMQVLAEKHGERFALDQYWQNKTNKY